MKEGKEMTTVRGKTRTIAYVCARCGRNVGRDNLLRKKVEFRELGESGRIVRSRTTAWLCKIKQEDGTDSCIHLDEDWNRQMYAESPGMSDTELAREARSA